MSGQRRRHRARRPPLSRRLVAAGSVAVLWGAWVLVATPGGATEMVRIVAESSSALVERPLPTVSAPTPSVLTIAPRPVGDAIPRTGELSRDRDPATPQPTSAPPTVGVDDVPPSGPGTFAVADGGTGESGTGGDLVTYTVEVEEGLPWDTAEVAEVVDGILADDRSWGGMGRWRVQRVAADGDSRILLASPDTVDRLCAPLNTAGRFSCNNGDLVVLNAVRWAGGAQTWGGDLDGYRGYLVNHEFGHYLGFGHVPCPVDGDPAPVMLQQTKTLDGCAPNAWPVVTGG